MVAMVARRSRASNTLRTDFEFIGCRRIWYPGRR